MCLQNPKSPRSLPDPLTCSSPDPALTRVQRCRSSALNIASCGHAFLSVSARRRPPFAYVVSATHGTRRHTEISELKRVKRENSISPGPRWIVSEEILTISEDFSCSTFAHAATRLRTSEENKPKILHSRNLRRNPLNLRKLEYSPNQNFFFTCWEIRIRHKTVQTRTSPRDLMDPSTGEIVGQSIIHVVEEKDKVQFVKNCADGVKATYVLTRTGARVFQAVLADCRVATL